MMLPPELHGPYIPAAFFFVISTFFTLNAARDCIDGIRSLEWPTVRGRTIGHGVSYGVTRHATDDALVVAYAYTVDGVEYQSARFDFAGRNSLYRAAELFRTYRVGRQVTVHYDPKRPERAVLEPGIGTWTLGTLLVGAAIMMVSAAITNEGIEILLAR